MNRKYLKIMLAILFLMVSMGVTSDALAAGGILENLLLAGGQSDLPLYDSPVAVVSLVIKAALGLVAIIFFIMIVVAGFRWMTAGGNEETVSKSKKNIGNAVIGLVVILFSYMITSFVFNILLENN